MCFSWASLCFELVKAQKTRCYPQRTLQVQGQVSGTSFLQPHVHLEPHHFRGVPAGDRKQYGDGLELRARPEIWSTAFQRWPAGSRRPLSFPGGKSLFPYSLQAKDAEVGAVSQEAVHLPQLAQPPCMEILLQCGWLCSPMNATDSTHQTKWNVLTTHSHHPQQPQDAGPRAQARF